MFLPFAFAEKPPTRLKSISYRCIFSWGYEACFSQVLSLTFKDSVHIPMPLRKKKHLKSSHLVMAIKEQIHQELLTLVNCSQSNKGGQNFLVKKKRERETRWSLFQAINPSVFKQPAAPFPFGTYWNAHNWFISGYTYTSVESLLWLI